MLPKLVEKCMRVQVYQFKKEDPAKFNWNNFMGNCMNSSNIRMNEDIVCKDVLLIDLNYFTTKHLTKVTPIGIRKIILITEVGVLYQVVFTKKLS